MANYWKGLLTAAVALSAMALPGTARASEGERPTRPEGRRPGNVVREDGPCERLRDRFQALRERRGEARQGIMERFKEGREARRQALRERREAAGKGCWKRGGKDRGRGKDKEGRGKGREGRRDKDRPGHGKGRGKGRGKGHGRPGGGGKSA